MTDIYLGIEGGGSKARAVAECRGRLFAYIQCASLNPIDVGFAEFGQRLCSLLGPLLERFPEASAGGARTIHVCAALAGAGRPAVRRRCRATIVRALKAYGSRGRVRVTTDAEALLERYLEDRDGMVLIAGTGSICMAARRVGGRRRLTRVGGKGGSLDAGSGYWIGTRVRAGLGAPGPGKKDAAPSTATLEEVSQSLPGVRSRVAALAPIVLRDYARGDKFARRVVAEAVSSLVGMVAAAADKAGIGDEVDLYLAGGLFKNEAFASLFKRRLRRVLPDVAPHIVADDLTAALELAKRGA
jgi:N-acetylglucosamine kinase-like BadF-type ATPase